MVWAPVGLSAQTVQGRISDEMSGEPLAFADVRLLTVDPEVAAVGVSDSAGRYRIRAPEPGSYRVQVDLIGYARLLSPLLALRAGRTITADFELPADPVELEGLRVEADALERIRDDLRTGPGSAWRPPLSCRRRASGPWRSFSPPRPP